MKDGGRLAAAIEVLEEVQTRHRPVQVSLKEWGAAHRFAGSGDRTAIGNLVFDALRNRDSMAARMHSHSPRALVLGTYAQTWAKGLDALQEAMANDRHAPEPLTGSEIEALSASEVPAMTAHAAADVPEWIWPQFEDLFGEEAVSEGRALAARAPVDLRVNTLNANREKLQKRLSHAGVELANLSPAGLRVPARPGLHRMPHVQAEEGYRKGWFELQDEASQLAALLAQARPGQQVLDYCAGGGGKTLALAAAMQNKGQLYAFDADRLRLAPIHERLQRAGVRNVQVRDPATSDLSNLEAQMDLVFVDAPCTGTGVWRRRPDSKWKLTENALADRVQDQREVLENACRYVKPGGWLLYATCSVLPAENAHQTGRFLEDHPEFLPVSALDAWRALLPDKPEPKYVSDRGDITLTPASTETDGFYISILEKAA